MERLRRILATMFDDVLGTLLGWFFERFFKLRPFFNIKARLSVRAV